mgnify:CR=1 FL=1
MSPAQYSHRVGAPSRRQWSKVPIVVVSARSHERDKVAALDLNEEAVQKLADELTVLTFLGFVLILVVGGCARVVSAGTVDQDIAGAEVGENLLMDGFKSLRIKDVRLVALADITSR